MAHETQRGSRTLGDDQVSSARITRRAAIGIVGAASLAVATVGIGEASAQGPRPPCSDADPYDPRGLGRRCGGYGGYGCSDADPYDPDGRGRSCAQYGCTDGDRYDPRGRGRGCAGGYCSDADRYDPNGRGRSCGGGAGCHPCRGVTDYDGRDPAGCGCQSGHPRYCYDGDPYDAGRGRLC